MPRTARIKYNTAIYHIMGKSISEITLFRNNKDKNVYLKYVKKYKHFFSFKIYAFCLMSNHVHFLIDSNGADISKFMHNINQCYAQYYNKKYNRNGPVFFDRFKSKIATSDSSILCISAYIHNNPKDIRGFKNNVENYNYSSLGVYLGKKKDTFGLLDRTFILQYFSADPILSVQRYFKFVKSRTGINIDKINNYEFINVSTNYKKYRKPLIRNIHPEKIIEFVSNSYDFNKSNINIKYNHTASEFRSVCVFLMRNLCDLHYSQICSIVGNLTLSSVSRLCNKGYYIIINNKKYYGIIERFLEKYKISYA